MERFSVDVPKWWEWRLSAIVRSEHLEQDKVEFSNSCVIEPQKQFLMLSDWNHGYVQSRRE